MPAPVKDRARRTEMRRAENAAAANRAATRARGRDSLDAYRPDTVTAQVYDAVEGGLGALARATTHRGNERGAAQYASRSVGNIKDLTEGLIGPDMTERSFRRVLGGRGGLEDYLIAGLTAAPGLGRLAGKYVAAPAVRAVRRAAPRAAEVTERAAVSVPRLKPQAPIEGASPRGPSAFPKRAAPEPAPQLTPRQEAFDVKRHVPVPTFSRPHPASPYITKEEGPFLHVKREGARPLVVPAARGASLDEQRAILANPETNQPAQIADAYTRENLGHGYDVNFPDPGTSLQKQSAIGRAFMMGATDTPGYKHALFERYGLMMPEVVEKSGAQNYDQLTEAAYRQLGREADRQFGTLPVEMRYHFGEGEYARPSGMLEDVLGQGRLNVFRGGDKHPYLSNVDPETGLTENEKFRAVHDYFGHATRGSTFRPGGEEVAYASHAQMTSPLAQMALLAETRGQNSVVNYSPQNAELLLRMNGVRDQIDELRLGDRLRGRRGASDGEIGALNAQLRELGEQTIYAPQKPLLLPPEFLSANTKGGMPDWLQAISRPYAPSAPERAVHLSHTPGLTATDPSFYGTGHRGDDWALRGVAGSPGAKTSFYLGDTGTVNPESMVAAVSPHAYQTQLSGLYDVGSDPERLVQLARAHNLKKTRLGKERAHIPDLMRLAQEYGYSGIRNPEFMPGQAAADVFHPVEGLEPIVRTPTGYAEGGIVE